MATLPTKEECAREVLKVFARHGSKAGHALQPNSFTGYAVKHRIPVADLNAGLEHGGEIGWFENGPNGSVKLTEAGFDQQVASGLVKVLTPEEKARIVLGIYAKAKARPGHALRPNNFMAYASNDFQSSDIADGLEYGLGIGWFEDGPNGSTRLTEAGFAEMP